MPQPLARFAGPLLPVFGTAAVTALLWAGTAPAALFGIALAQWAAASGRTKTAQGFSALVLIALLPGFFSYVTPEALISTGQWQAAVSAVAPEAALTQVRPPLLATLALMLLALIPLLRQRARLGAPLLLAGAGLLVAAQLACRLWPLPIAPLLAPGFGVWLAPLAGLTLSQLLLARARWQGKPRLNRALVPASALLCAVLVLWQYQYRHVETRLHDATRQEGDVLAGRLADDVHRQLDAMRRFAHAWQLLHTSPSARQWRRQAARLYDDDFRYLVNIAFIHPDSRIIHVYPHSRLNTSVRGQHLFAAQPQSRPVIEAALSGRGQTSTGIIELLQGGPGIIYYLPMRDADDTLTGAAAMVISLPLLADTLFDALRPDRALWTWHGPRRVLARFGSPSRPGPWRHRYRLDLSGQTLEIVQRPRRDYLLARRSRLPAITLTIGLVLAYLLYMVLYTLRRLGEQNVAFQRSNAQLQEEIDERRRLQQAVEWLAHHDELTGLANRRRFLEQVDSLRDAPPLSLVLCDIDHFKRVNDQLGHLTGDEYLKAVAGIGQAVMAEYGGFFARYGGEEFIGCLPGAHHARACHAADTLRQRLFQRALRQADGSRVSLSAGVVTYHGGRFDLPRMMQAADDALYRAKRQGRNRTESAAPLAE